jgi:DNA-directed RNA polymerase specialized sigma24 family protein
LLVADNSLKAAFTLYSEALERRATLTDDQAEEFILLTSRYITHCVRGLVSEVDPDHADLVNECLLKTWSTASSGRYPTDRIERFVAGLKAVCRNRCLDLLDGRKSRSLVVELLRENLPYLPPMTPEGETAFREEDGQTVEQIARNMLAHKRHAFRELKIEHCRAVATRLLARGSVADIESYCKEAGFFRWHSYAVFLWTIYRWEFREYRIGMLRLLDSLRPTG